MATKATVPAIRFAGFTTPWELRKFDNLYIRAREKNDLSYGKDKIISVANMYFKTNNYITDDEYLKTYNVFKLGDIAFEGNKSKHFAHGRFVENTIGDGIVSHVFDVFRPKTTYDLLFWKHLINNESIMSDLLVRCTKSSTMMTNLVADDFLKESLLVPKVEEQRLIGKYLSQLDELIALQRRKLVQLQNVKKAMLQKMLPTRGSTTPQIRFAGFTDPWEECALADALSLLKDGTHGTHTNVGDGYYLLSAKNIKNGSVVIDPATDRMISEDEFKKIHWNFQLKKGDVLLTIVGSIGESAIIDNPEKITFQRSVAYLRPNNRTTSEFLLSTIASSQFQDELQNRQVVSAQPGIYLGVLGAITVQFPKIAEQIKIGAYFKHLDTRISLQQRKLEKLQNVKKACLAAMFV